MSQVKTIFAKEFKDTLRDKRTMASLVYIVIGLPILMMAMFYLNTLGDDDRADTIIIEGAEMAPGLVAFLEKSSVTVQTRSISTELPEKLGEGVDALLRIPADFSEKLAAGQPISMPMFVDESSRDSLLRQRRIQASLARYSGYVGGIRLMARGVPSIVAQPIHVTNVNIADTSFLSRFSSQFLLVIFVLGPFLIGMPIAIDILAGERERSSLQTLLTLPVSARLLTLGKWATVVSFGFTGASAILAIVLLELKLIPLDFITVTPHVDIGTLTILGVSILALAMFAAALQLFVSIQARSFREAQMYMSLVLALPAIGAQVKVILDDKLPEFVRYLPIIADMENASSLLYDGKFEPAFFVTALAISLLGTAIFLTLTMRRLESERLLDEA